MKNVVSMQRNLYPTYTSIDFSNCLTERLNKLRIQTGSCHAFRERERERADGMNCKRDKRHVEEEKEG